VLTTLASTFQSLADRKVIRGDPLLVAHHFVALLLWIPVNKAMFTETHDSTSDELESHAALAVRAFLIEYGSSSRVLAKSPEQPRRMKSRTTGR
jgi:TetR/AcrR family transcriptional repressor of mexJK operon